MSTAIKPERFPWFDYSKYTFSLGLDLGGGTAVLSGHTASEFDPESRRIVVRGTLADQVRTAYNKIEAILEGAGLSLADVVRVCEYVKVSAIDDYGEIERVRKAMLLGAQPTVNTVVVDALLRPDALLEIEVMAKKGGAEDPFDGVVYLPSLELGDGSDLEQQANLVYDRAQTLLGDLGLSLGGVTKTLTSLALGNLEAYEKVAAGLRSRLGDVAPAATVVLAQRLRSPRAKIQVDMIASRNPAEGIGVVPDNRAASPAVRAGRVLFMSGVRAADGGADVLADAERIYSTIGAVLKQAGVGTEALVKTNEYVVPAALQGYRGVAEVRSRHLREPFPSSTGLVVPEIRDGCLIEVDPIAVLAAR